MRLAKSKGSVKSVRESGWKVQRLCKKCKRVAGKSKGFVKNIRECGW